MFPILVWIKAASGLWLMEPPEKGRHQPGVASFCPGSICRSWSHGSTGEQGGGGRLSSQQELPPTAHISFAHSDLSTPSPLPFGVPTGGPKKSALLTKQVSVASFSSFFFFFLKYCKFIFSPQHFSLHCSST